MSTLTKRVLAVLVVVALMLAAAFAGGTYGFMQGYVHGLGDTSVRASAVTTTLRTLRRGEVAKGINLLEGHLDTLIVEHWGAERANPPLLSWRVGSDDALDRKLFARVGRYRSEYPSPAIPVVRNTVERHLKSFAAP